MAEDETWGAGGSRMERAPPQGPPELESREVGVPTSGARLSGTLAIPRRAQGIVLFAHGSGSSRFSPRNRYVASVLRDAGLGTLLIDLLTPQEEEVDLETRHLRFDIGLLARRLVGVVDWLREEDATRDLEIGLFGSSTGGGGALVAAADRPGDVSAVVSRGGRPDLAGDALPRVRAATLLIVGGRDEVVLDLNRQAFDELRTDKELSVVPGATHLFEEPGALDEVAHRAADWFRTHLGRREPR